MTHGPVPLTHTRRKEALLTVREGRGAAAMTQRRDGRPAPGARPGSRQAEATTLSPFSPLLPHHSRETPPSRDGRGARDTARREAPPPSRAHGGGGGRGKAEGGARA